MPATFLIRARLVDPQGNPRPDVPVRAFVFDHLKGAWTAFGDFQTTNGEGHVELDVSGTSPVVPALLAFISLRHDDTDAVLAEQWASFETHEPASLDFGEIRVWDSPIADLGGRSIAGVPATIVAALGSGAGSGELEDQLAAALAELASTQAELASTQAELTTAQNQLASTQGQLTTAQNELTTAQNALVSTQGQLTTAQNQLASTQNALVSTQGQLTTAQTALSATQSQLTTTQNALVATQSQLAELQTTHTGTQAQLAATQGSLAQLQATHATTLAELASVTSELQELQASIGSPTSLESVVDSVGAQLQATQSRLVSNGSPFQLGRVSLSLKVVPATSTSFGLPTLDQLASVGGDALSTLDLSFAQTASASTEPPTDAAVPSLVGLTEPAARRRLVPLGLGASVVHQAIADDGDVSLAGRVIKQIPAAGAPIQPGQVVTLVLGKALEAAPT